MYKLLVAMRTIGILIFTASIIGCARLDTELYQPSVPQGVSPTRVKAVIVMANKSAFEKYNHKLQFPLCCYPPALLLFSTAENKGTLALRKLSREIAALKGTVQSDQDKQLMADEVTNETYVEHRFVRVPSSISGDDSTYLAHAIRHVGITEK